MASILIVEGHEIFAEQLLRVLRERGHWDVVAVAHSAEEAIGPLPNLEVVLVQVDVSLPHRSGISLVHDLRQGYPDLRCAMVSGHASEHYVHNSLAAGARCYLMNEDTVEILDGIRRVLQGEVFISERVQ